VGKVWDEGALVIKNSEDFLDFFNTFQSSGPVSKSFYFPRVNGDTITIQSHP
jgi:hypothetical protein